jgi:hypothetical protein
VGRGREGARAAAGKHMWVVAKQGVGQPPRAAWVAAECELARRGSWSKRGRQQELSRTGMHAPLRSLVLIQFEERRGKGKFGLGLGCGLDIWSIC